MTAQVLFFDVFSEKDPHLNAVEPTLNEQNNFNILNLNGNGVS